MKKCISPVRLDEGDITEGEVITATLANIPTFTTKTHTFAIVETLPGANPYDMGAIENLETGHGKQMVEVDFAMSTTCTYRTK